MRSSTNLYTTAMKLTTPFLGLAAAIRIYSLPNGFLCQWSAGASSVRRLQGPQARLFTTSLQRNKSDGRGKKSLKNRLDPRISAHYFSFPCCPSDGLTSSKCGPYFSRFLLLLTFLRRNDPLPPLPPPNTAPTPIITVAYSPALDDPSCCAALVA